MNWLKKLDAKIKKKVRLCKYTTFKIGGCADYVIEPKDEANLRKLLVFARKAKLRVLVIGAGSNILACDSRIRGIVIRLSSPHFRKILVKGNFIDVGAGCAVSRVILRAARSGLGGAEFLTGIPATLGGAIAMNAGTKDASIGEIVEKLSVMDYNGRKFTLSRNRVKFKYRDAGLGRYIILGARLVLEKSPKAKIYSKMSAYMLARRRSIDWRHPSAGCVFKNPAGDSAGRLIDSCGLKGKKVGGAEVSRKHANFIVNTGSATCADVLMLMKQVKSAVRARFAVTLRPEIKIWR